MTRTGPPGFVLVHGAWHGSYAWDMFRVALHQRGCRSIAVDLPIGDTAVDGSGYARVIAAAAATLGPEPSVVVGHSMAGISLPLVPRLTPVSRLVFLAGLIPEPGRSMSEVQAREEVLGDTSALARDASGRTYWTSLDAAIGILYHDCDAGLAGAAAGKLRPQARTPHAEPCPLDVMPDVPTDYIVMRKDRMIRPEWSRGAPAARSRTDRAGRRTLSDAG
jgi:pimeloyl-ACP methyl ester carboxylesterase